MDTELIAVLAGLKPALRVTSPPGEAEALAVRLRARKLAVVRADTLASIGGEPSAVLYAARAEHDAILLRDAEARVLPGSARVDETADVDAHLEIGRRLGFPRCCVEAFCERLTRGLDLHGGGGGISEDYVAARDAWTERPDARLNNLLFAAQIKLVSFYPCRYDCAVASRFAGALLDVLEGRWPDDAGALRAALSRSVVIAPSGARALVTLGPDGSIASAEPPRDARGRVIAPADETFASSLHAARSAANGEVRGPGDPSAWLVPFGARL